MSMHKSFNIWKSLPGENNNIDAWELTWHGSILMVITSAKNETKYGCSKERIGKSKVQSSNDPFLYSSYQLNPK